MPLLGSVAFLLFVTFPVYPLVYLGRLLFRARTRAPLVLIAFHLQTVSFVVLAGWFAWAARPMLAPLALSGFTVELGIAATLLLWISDAMRTLPGAALALAAAVAILRLTGRWIANRWRDPAVHAWRIDAAAMLAWFAMCSFITVELLSLLAPLVTVLE